MIEMLPVQKRSQIFGDDSSKTGHTYFVYGSLHVPQVRFRAVEQKLKLALGDYRHRYTLASLIAKRTRIAGYKLKGQPAVPQGDVRTLGHYTVKQREKGFGIFHLDLTKSKHWKRANRSA